LGEIELQKFAKDAKAGSLTVTGKLEVQYLNVRKSAIEPLLEPWRFKVQQLTRNTHGTPHSEILLSNYKDKNTKRRASVQHGNDSETDEPLPHQQ
jgi:hypothetical protein